MAAKYGPISTKEQDKRIAGLRGLVANVNEEAQAIAVGIIAHAAKPASEGGGNGDVSRAIKLVQALPLSMNRTFMLRYLLYFGSIGINLKDGTCKVVSRDSKNFRGFDVDGAVANKWYEPFDEDGNRAHWYEGPNPRQFEPNTAVDFVGNVHNFIDRINRQLDETKKVNGTDVPLYRVDDETKANIRRVLGVMKKATAILGARDAKAELERQIAELDTILESGDELLAEGDGVDLRKKAANE